MNKFRRWVTSHRNGLFRGSVLLLLAAHLLYGLVYRETVTGRRVGPQEATLNAGLLIALFITLIFFFWAAMQFNESHEKADRHEQFMSLAMQRIGALEESKGNQTNAGAVWPWGTHETSLLRHLGAAADRWWKLYDPERPDTAPTNKEVVDWLTNERGVTENIAKAIATILRADGLRTGPRG